MRDKVHVRANLSYVHGMPKYQRMFNFGVLLLKLKLRIMHTIKLLLISFGAQVSTNHNGVFPGCTMRFDWLKVWQVSAPVLLNFKLYLGHYATKYYYNYHFPEALRIKNK